MTLKLTLFARGRQFWVTLRPLRWRLLREKTGITVGPLEFGCGNF